MSKILLALLLVALTVGSAWTFWSGNWWFVHPISEHGPKVDDQFNRTLVVVGFAFITCQLALAWAVFRYGRKGNERSKYTHGNNKLEAVWTVITAVVFVVVAVYGQIVWAGIHLNQPSDAEATNIEVVAQQFQWNFHYPGADGVTGKTNTKFINDGSLNFVGVDPDDPNGKDDIQISTLVVPEKRPVALRIRSKDVIHSLFVPALRIKQDAVPGMNVRIHFKATEVGKYEIACAELCGSLHFNMKTFLLVLPQEDYDALTAMTPEKYKERLGQLMERYEVNSSKVIAAN
ncbi:MAG: cytochrome c oxidase subunit II [Acidobacteriota bacterium]